MAIKSKSKLYWNLVIPFQDILSWTKVLSKGIVHILFALNLSVGPITNTNFDFYEPSSVDDTAQQDIFINRSDTQTEEPAAIHNTQIRPQIMFYDCQDVLSLAFPSMCR